MATNYKIATEFSIIDRASATLNKMQSAGGLVGNAWKNGIQKAQLQLNAFGHSVANVGKMAAGIGIGAAAAGLVVATKQYADFEASVRSAGAAYGSAFINASDFEAQLKKMEVSVRNVAAATEFDAVQAGKAMETLAKAGVNAEQAIGLLPGVADLATAACTGMDEAVELAIGSLNVLGMKAKEPEILAANMTKLSDVMVHTANSAKMSLQDVGNAISQTGSFFSNANNDLNVLSGSLTALANRSIAGSEAGVHLRNIMVNLSSPTAKASAALKAMNIQTQDANGNLLPLPKIIGQMNKAMANMGTATRSANLYDIFGKQNIPAVEALLAAGQDALENYAKAAENSAGAVTAAAKAMRGGLLNQFKVLQSALTELGFKFVEAFKGKGSDALKNLTEAVSSFDPTPLINGLVKAVDIVIGFAKAAWNLRGAIAVVAAAFVAWKTATMGAAIVLGTYNTVMAIAQGAQIAYGIVVNHSAAAQSAFAFASNGAKVATIVFSGVLKVATAASAAFNAVLAANPIGLIIVGVVALIAAIIALALNWKKVSAAVDGFFDRIRNMQGIGGAILQFIAQPFEAAWTVIHRVFDIFEAFKSGGFLNGIKMLGLTILEFVAAPIRAVLGLISKIPGLGFISEGVDAWFENTRNGLLGKTAAAGTTATGAEAAMAMARAGNAAAASPARSAESAMALARSNAANNAAMVEPTRTAAAANSYSRSESVTTNRLEVGLADGLVPKGGSYMGAPAFTLDTGRR